MVGSKIDWDLLGLAGALFVVMTLVMIAYMFLLWYMLGGR
jgi:hypothetical protein